MIRNILLTNFIIVIFSGCTSMGAPLKNILDDKNIREYTPLPYDALKSDPGASSEEVYQDCNQRIEKLRYKFYSLTYKSGELNIQAIIGLPPTFDIHQKHPLLVFNRGGNRNFGYLNSCYLPMLQHFASTVPNAVVVASQYRGSHESEGQDEFGGKDVDDILNLIRWTENQPYIDSESRFIAGWSRGGMMTYLVLKQHVSFKAAVVVAGNSNLFRMEKLRPPMAKLHQELIPEYQSNKDKSLKARSAVYWPDRINVPTLIIHGTEDWRVSVEDARQMSRLLKKHGRSYKYVEYTDDHDLSHSYRNALDEIKEWFAKYQTHIKE